MIGASTIPCETEETKYRAKQHKVLFPNLRARSDLLVLLWVGRAYRPALPSAQADAMIEFVLAPLLNRSALRESHQFPSRHDLGDPILVEGSVAEIPRLQLGTVYLHGSPIHRFSAEKKFFPEISIPGNGGAESFFSKKDEDGAYLVPFDQFYPHADMAGTPLIEVSGVPDASGQDCRLLFPWFVLDRFFFCGSCQLQNLLFYEGLEAMRNRIYDKDKSGWIPQTDGHFALRLEKWVPDRDARIIAHLATNDSFRRAANALHRPLDGRLGDGRKIFPKCLFPTSSMKNVLLRGLSTESGVGSKSFLVLEIVRANIRSGIEHPLNGIVIWRDNDGRSASDFQRELAEARSPHPQSRPPDVPENQEFDHQPGAPGNTSKPIRPVNVINYYSSFADDDQIPVWKPAKDDQETRNNPGLILTKGLSDQLTTDPGGDNGGTADRLRILSGDDPFPTEADIPEGNDRLSIIRAALVRVAQGHDLRLQWMRINDVPCTTAFYSEFIDLKEFGTKQRKGTLPWVSVALDNKETRPRRYWVCSIYNPETDRYFYVVEIEHRRKTEAFSGCILYDIRISKRLPEELIAECMNACAAQRGKWSKVVFNPPLERQPYEHRKWNKLNDNDNKKREVEILHQAKKLWRYVSKKKPKSQKMAI